MILQPQPDEYTSFQANYINLAIQAGADIQQTLILLKDSTYQFLSALPTEKADYAYDKGKWTIKQLISHMIDAERIFAYRILRFSRQDQTNLPGFDENTYVENTLLTNHTLAGLAQEFKAVREANLYMYNAITQPQSILKGLANTHTTSVRALLYIAAGHELHHLNILREKYM